MPMLSTSIFGFGVYIWYEKNEYFVQFGLFCGFNILLYAFVLSIIPTIKDLTLKVFYHKIINTKKANIFGKDINKKGTPAGEVQIPESLGIAPAVGYLIFNTLLL